MQVGIQQSLDSQVKAGSVREQLRHREVSRTSEEGSETVTYDTGQQIQRTLKTIKAPRDIQNITGEPTAQIVETSVSNSRNGYVSRSGPVGGGSDMSGAREGYPELQKIFDSFESTRTTSYSLVTPAIMHVPALFLGHGNIPPWALLHPVVIAKVVLGTIWPFEREEGFRMSKAEAHFRKQDQLIEPSKINGNYDGFVACVRPDPLLSIGSPAGVPSAIELLIFNPKLLAETKKQDVSDRFVAEIPSADKTLFRLDGYIGSPGGTLNTGMSAFPYSHNKFDAVHPITLQGIEEERKGGFYIKMDRATVEQLARLSPLPVEESDCGVSLGYPEINNRYAELRMSAHARTEIIRQLKKECGSLVAALNSDAGWHAFSGQKDEEMARPLLIRSVFNKGASAGFEVERQARPVATDETDLVRRFIELNDHEREMVGLKDAAHTHVELKLY